MTEIKLDPSSVAAIASAAILDHIGEDQKNEIMKQAVQHLLAPQKTAGYGLGKTPLQEAFNSAISQAAYTVVRERVESDPQVIAAINELLGPLIQGALNAEAKEYNSELADTIGRAVGQWLAEVAKKNAGRY